MMQGGGAQRARRAAPDPSRRRNEQGKAGTLAGPAAAGRDDRVGEGARARETLQETL
jgi:hypothetical protein